MARVVPYWNAQLAPRVRAGERLISAAHGNRLRALVKHPDRIADEHIAPPHTTTGTPLVYDLDANPKTLAHRPPHHAAEDATSHGCAGGLV